MSATLTPAKNLPLDELSSRLRSLGEPAFRARQVVKWIYQKRLDSFEAMNNIPKAVRSRLAGVFSLRKLAVPYVRESRRGDAVKFGFSCADGRRIVESVVLYDDKRRTACLSSQLGCGLRCAFCATGRMGLVRNLTLEEIIGQLVGIDDYLASRSDKLVTNIVFMGMGEALSNFDAFRQALDVLMSEDAFGIGGRRITVSTAGVVPSIDRLMQENLNVGLAISLNTYDDDKRTALMPINRQYPIAALVDAANRYFDKTGRRVTFEYIVVEGENDTPRAAAALENLLKATKCKINLIPLNPTPDFPARAPNDRRMAAFADELFRRGLTPTLRKSRGSDVLGACGQLGGSSS